MIASAEGVQSLLARLKSLKRGATWRDVFPDLPESWASEPDDEDLPTYQHSLGPFDYAEPPWGAAYRVGLASASTEADGQAFVAEAGAAGWPVLGATIKLDGGRLYLERALSREATAAQETGFSDWLWHHPAVSGFTGLRDRHSASK